MAYRLVLFSHVLGAIVAVGPAITYGVWLGLARRERPEGVSAPVYQAYRRLMRALSPLISVGTIAIVYLMVVKPGRG